MYPNRYVNCVRVFLVGDNIVLQIEDTRKYFNMQYVWETDEMNLN